MARPAAANLQFFLSFLFFYIIFFCRQNLQTANYSAVGCSHLLRLRWCLRHLSWGLWQRLFRLQQSRPYIRRISPFHWQTVLRLWGVNLRERKWWKDSWWQNYEIRTSVRWRMDWGLSCAFCLFTFLCFCVLNIMHWENVWYSWLAWIHHGWLKSHLG